MSPTEIVRRGFEAFAAETAAPPTISLRGGDAIDDYKLPPPFDANVDAITDEYLFRYKSGVSYLDPVSWRHYLPHLVEHAVRLYQQDSDVIDALLNSLRPPDREPPRLASLSPDQEAVVIKLLDLLAFSAESSHQDLACQVLEEWWGLPRCIEDFQRDAEYTQDSNLFRFIHKAIRKFTSNIVYPGRCDRVVARAFSQIRPEPANSRHPFQRDNVCLFPFGNLLSSKTALSQPSAGELDYRKITLYKLKSSILLALCRKNIEFQPYRPYH